ncbi:MAG: hypothetical protein IKC40_01865 [Oscillospiraceae bacterium]|nr:hypothetical protein [Oscillospiraceae bacterium]
MKYHKHIKDILHGADDQTAAEIAEMTNAADEKTKERIYAMTCERLAQNNGAAETNGESFRVTVTRRPSWMRSAATAAACLVIAGGLTGGAVMLHRSAQSTPTPEFAEQTKDEQTTTAVTQLKIQKEWTEIDNEESTTKSLETLYIEKIVDRAKEEGLPFDEALEKIHEDEENEYFLSGIYSHYVIVHYSDGTQEDIKSALKSGRATITDMDRFGIHYWKEPKETTEPPTKTTEETNASQTGLCSDPLQSTTTIGETSSPVCSDPLQSTTTTTTTTETYYPVCSHPLQSTTTKPQVPTTNKVIADIVNRAMEEGLPVADALEKIHEDDKNEYYFPAIYSHYVIVHYSDGTQEDIKSALKNGRAKLSDLDRFGIDYYTEPKEVENSVDPTLHPLYKKYPEYFNLSTFKGLEVYVWQMSGSSYYCGVLEGTNRLKTEEEIQALMMNGATIEEMKEILAVYGIGKNEIFIMPVSNPVSSYWYEIDQDYRRKIEAMFWDE